MHRDFRNLDISKSLSERSVFLFRQDFLFQPWPFFQVGKSLFSFGKITSNPLLYFRLVGFGGSISAGGPSSLFWGWVTVVPFVFCVSLCMSEIISGKTVLPLIFRF
jgi:hypothetical protein